MDEHGKLFQVNYARKVRPMPLRKLLKARKLATTSGFVGNLL